MGQEEQIPAFTGLYPVLGGWTNWGMLFTRHRLLTWDGASVREYVASTGPVRGPLKRESKLPLVEVSSGRTYDKVEVAGKAYWIHRRHRGTVLEWAAASAR